MMIWNWEQRSEIHSRMEEDLLYKLFIGRQADRRIEGAEFII